MNSAKHTDGPWIVHGYNVYGPVDPRSKHFNGRVLIGGVVDDVKEWRAEKPTAEDRASFEAETKANLALLGAAPALLKALKAVVSVADRKTDEFDLAHAAIAQAEGRS